MILFFVMVYHSGVISFNPFVFEFIVVSGRNDSTIRGYLFVLPNQILCPLHARDATIHFPPDPVQWRMTRFWFETRNCGIPSAHIYKWCKLRFCTQCRTTKAFATIYQIWFFKYFYSLKIYIQSSYHYRIVLYVAFAQGRNCCFYWSHELWNVRQGCNSARLLWWPRIIGRTVERWSFFHWILLCQLSCY